MIAARPAAARLAGLLLSLALAGAGAAAQTELVPVDEAAQRPEFFSFRARLASAVARRDAAAVLDAVDEQVKTGFGGDDGRAAFERQWEPRRADSRLWEVLGAVLALGGSFTAEDRFSAPYVYSRWPEDLDAFTHVAVTGSEVRLRGAPRAGAPVVGGASFALLDLTGPATGDGWFPVRTADGRAAYVSAAYARSPLDYRAIFERRDGAWRLVAFVSGD
jgi:hypothetical protein